MAQQIPIMPFLSELMDRVICGTPVYLQIVLDTLDVKIVKSFVGTSEVGTIMIVRGGRVTLRSFAATRTHWACLVRLDVIAQSESSRGREHEGNPAGDLCYPDPIG
jgi:hypothetical protein